MSSESEAQLTRKIPAVGSEFLALSSSLTVVWAWTMSPEFRAFMGSKPGFLASFGSLALAFTFMGLTYRDQKIWTRLIAPVIAPLVAFLFMWIMPIYVLMALHVAFYRGKSQSTFWIYAVMHAWTLLIIEAYLGWTAFSGEANAAQKPATVAFVMLLLPTLLAFLRIMYLEQSPPLYERETTGNHRQLVAFLMVIIPWLALWFVRHGLWDTTVAITASGMMCGIIEAAARRIIAKHTVSKAGPPPTSEKMPWDRNTLFGFCLLVLLVIVTRLT